jgi:hypothetical protein
MKNKFTIEKNYNISIIAEGLDVNQAEVEFSLLLKDFKITLPLKNIKENVFRLRIPSKIKDTIKGIKEIDYSINVRNDNLIFEVAKSKFELEFFAVKEVKILEAADDDAEDIVIEHMPKMMEQKVEIAEAAEEKTTPVEEPKPITKKKQARQIIENIINKNKKLG